MKMLADVNAATENTPMQGIFYSPGRPCRVLVSSMWSNNIPKAPLSWVARLVSVFRVRSHRCYENASRRYTPLHIKHAHAGHLLLTRSALPCAGILNVVQQHPKSPPELGGSVGLGVSGDISLLL